MAGDSFTPLSVFYSYSHKDEDLRLELEAHLAALRRSGLISEWHDRMIDAGQQWKNQIDQHLDSANLILFLISADFINSGYCMDVEVARALERHKRREAVLVPIILRPVLWQVIPCLEELQALPKNALPIIQWTPRDLAYVSVCEGILRLVHRSAPPEPRRVSSSRARKRFFDAAIPARVPLRKPSALLVMVRRSDSTGLTGIVEAEPEYHMSGNDVRSKPATLHFPTQDGVPQPLDLTVKVESPQFYPELQSKTIHVPPKGDSQPQLFFLIPTGLGDLMLNVELCLGTEQIASCMLHTEGIPAERADEPPRQNTATSAAPNLEQEADQADKDIDRAHMVAGAAAPAPRPQETTSAPPPPAPAQSTTAPGLPPRPQVPSRSVELPSVGSRPASGGSRTVGVGRAGPRRSSFGWMKYGVALCAIMVAGAFVWVGYVNSPATSPSTQAASAEAPATSSSQASAPTTTQAPPHTTRNKPPHVANRDNPEHAQQAGSPATGQPMETPSRDADNPTQRRVELLSTMRLWRLAVEAGDAEALRTIYPTIPADLLEGITSGNNQWLVSCDNVDITGASEEIVKCQEEVRMLVTTNSKGISHEAVFRNSVELRFEMVGDDGY